MEYKRLKTEESGQAEARDVVLHSVFPARCLETKSQWLQAKSTMTA